MSSLFKNLWLALFLFMMTCSSVYAASVAPADEAAVRGIVQKTWAPFGTTGVLRGPRYDPPRTTQFAALKKRCDALNRDHNEEACEPDNPYCQCWNEYRPYAGRVQIVGVDGNTINARVAILMGTSPGYPSTQTTAMRFVRSPSGWLLDDVFGIDNQGNRTQRTSLKEMLRISIDEMR